jgi:hypothetical protein
MWIVCLLLGFFVGCLAGLILAAWMAVESDKRAVADGVIKLCGKLYVLTNIKEA